MSFDTIYRSSFYLMLFFATLTLSVDVPESPIAHFYPAAVALAGVFALLTVDRNPRLGMPRTLFNVMALGSGFPVLLEYLSNRELLLLALAHWLVYLQLIKMFLPKRPADDWFLFLLGLMQVLVGAVGSQSDRVGMAMGCWSLLALWVLALFSLHRDALRFGASAPIEALPPTRKSMGGSTDPYPGLLDPPFLFSALRVTATTMALGGVIFLAMPRRPSMARYQSDGLPARHMTGFDEEIKLGQLGEILENDSVVMNIELFDYDWKRIIPSPETLWRGVTMASYENGRWTKQRWVPTSFPSIPTSVARSHNLIRQRVRLEPTDSPVLFGLRPMLDATSGPRSMPELNALDGTVSRQDPRVETYEYQVLSFNDPGYRQPGEIFPRRSRTGLLVSLPQAVREPLKQITERELAEIPAEYPLRRARALEHYFKLGFFKYTLHLTVVDPDIDPVLDFLVNRKAGHCGYFASAMVLMLRSAGIPARMVNGFKGGDWNGLAQILSVRQKHAHSWVEALIQMDPGEDPVWMSFDPTPGAERNEAVASVGGFASNFRELTDLVRYVWVFYIVGYNVDRQWFLIYEPTRQLILEARSGFQMMGQTLQSLATTVFVFRDFDSLLSIRGFLVSFSFLLVLAGLIRVSVWSWGWGQRWLRGDREERGPLSASQVSYRRLVQLLSAFGLDRPAAETPHEFAHRASSFLTGRGSSTAEVADVPLLVVAAYYRVRFGHRELAAAALERLEHRLDALEASLNANAV